MARQSQVRGAIIQKQVPSSAMETDSGSSYMIIALGRAIALRAKVYSSFPHPVASCTGHHLADQTLIYAKAHMYLDGLLRNQRCGPVGLQALRKLGLLEFGALGNG